MANINTSTTSLTESVIRFASNTTSDVTLASNTTNYTFNVTSNVAYTVTVPDLQNQSPLQQWLRVNTSNRAGAGNTSSNIGLFLQPNTSNDDRSVNVVSYSRKRSKNNNDSSKRNFTTYYFKL